MLVDIWFKKTNLCILAFHFNEGRKVSYLHSCFLNQIVEYEEPEELQELEQRYALNMPFSYFELLLQARNIFKWSAIRIYFTLIILFKCPLQQAGFIVCKLCGFGFGFFFLLMECETLYFWKIALPNIHSFPVFLIEVMYMLGHNCYAVNVWITKGIRDF